jgi:hypothetical protein
MDCGSAYAFAEEDLCPYSSCEIRPPILYCPPQSGLKCVVTLISPRFGVEGDGVPTCSVIPVITCVFPIVVRELPRELRDRIVGWRFVGRHMWCGRESGRVWAVVNLDRYA